MSEAPLLNRRVVRLLNAAFGVALLVWLVHRLGLASLIEDVSRLGWRIALVVALGGIAHVAKALAWRLALPPDENNITFLHFFKLRLASEAIGQLGILGQAFGEGLRVSALGSDVPISSRLSSVAIDRGLFVVTGAIVVLVGLVSAPFSLNLAQRWLLYARVFAVGLIILLLALFFAIQKRWPVLSCSARFSQRLGCCRAWLVEREHLITSIENRLFSFHRDSPRAFWASLGLNVLTHIASLCEIYVVLLLMGFNIGILGSLVFEALTKLVNVIGLLNPGNVGTYEGGNVLIARMFSLSSDTGLILAVARRIRSIFWAGIGSVCLLKLNKNRYVSQENSGPQDETQRISVPI